MLTKMYPVTIMVMPFDKAVLWRHLLSHTAHSTAETKGEANGRKMGVTFLRCLLTHLVNVFFWIASRSSAMREKEHKSCNKSVSFLQNEESSRARIESCYVKLGRCSAQIIHFFFKVINDPPAVRWWRLKVNSRLPKGSVCHMFN